MIAACADCGARMIDQPLSVHRCDDCDKEHRRREFEAQKMNESDARSVRADIGTLSDADMRSDIETIEAQISRRLKGD